MKLETLFLHADVQPPPEDEHADGVHFTLMSRFGPAAVALAILGRPAMQG